jgi:transcriptional regulator with XRE-family HTH domain
MHKLKKRFLDKGFSVKYYAKRVGVNRVILSKLLNGHIEPVAKRESSAFKNLLEALRRDGVLDEG